MSTEFLQLCLWLLFVAIMVYLYYSGLLHDIHVMIGKPEISEQIEIVYKFGTGPFKNVGAVFKDLKGRVPRPTKFIGIYYDDPQETPSEELRWAVGAISKIDGKLAPELQADTVVTLQFDGYKVAKLGPIENAVITEFCNTTFLSMFLAIARVYSYIKKFLKQNDLKAYPMIEMYYGKKIVYCLPLKNQEDFFLPETKKTS